MTDALEKIRAEIEELLDPAERDQLAASLAYADRRRSIDLSRIEEEVIASLRSITSSRVPSQVFVRDYGINRFRGRVAELQEYISDTRKLLRPAQVSDLIQKCLRMLAADLRSRDIPVTPSSILNSMGILRSAVDQRFPGYAQAGHLHRLVGGRVLVE